MFGFSSRQQLENQDESGPEAEGGTKATQVIPALGTNPQHERKTRKARSAQGGLVPTRGGESLSVSCRDGGSQPLLGRQPTHHHIIV